MTAYFKRFSLLLSYYAALTLSYWLYFKPVSRQDYFEVNWVPPATDDFAPYIAIALAVALSSLAATARNTPTQLFSVVLLLTPVMPMLVVYTDRRVHGMYIFACAVMYVVAFTIMKLPYAHHTRRESGIAFINPRHLSTYMLALVGLFILCDIAVGNLANLNFDFNRVYEFRRLAEATRGTLLGYFETNLTSFFLGLGTVVAIHRRQYGYVALFAASAVMLFGLTSARGHFFIVFLTIAFYFVARRRDPFVWIVGGATITCVIAALFYQLSPSFKAIGDFAVGRMLFIPAIGNYLFYDFFSVHPFTYWSDTRFSFGLVANPYGISGPRVVFDYYYGQDLSQDVFYGNANTGFLGAGYAHAGYVGMFFYAVLVGWMTRVVGAYARRTGDAIAIGAFAFMFVVPLFTSSDVPTLFLTHSYLFALLLVVFLKRWPEKRRRAMLQKPDSNLAAALSPKAISPASA